MTKMTRLCLNDCPEQLQKAVEEHLQLRDADVVSVTLTEDTPYLDKTIVTRQYRVILNDMNLVTVLRCCGKAGHANRMEPAFSLAWGDIAEILHSGGPGTMMAGLWEAIPEEKKRLYTI